MIVVDRIEAYGRAWAGTPSRGGSLRTQAWGASDPATRLRAMPRIAAIWRSPRKRAVMQPSERARAVEDHGLEGCAHARAGTKRQVLFASAQHLDALEVPHGAIKENFTVEGVDVHSWPVGQRIGVGDAEFEVTMECDPCERMEEIRPGLQQELEGRRGMLARVVKTGKVAVGDEVRLI